MNDREIIKELFERSKQGDDFARGILDMIHHQSCEMGKQNLRVFMLEQQIKCQKLVKLLSPCPKCEGENIRIKGQVGCYYVECEECELRTKQYEDASQAVNAWENGEYEDSQINDDDAKARGIDAPPQRQFDVMRRFTGFMCSIDAPQVSSITVEIPNYANLRFPVRDILEGVKALERKIHVARKEAKKYRDKYALACGEPVETLKLPWESDRAKTLKSQDGGRKNDTE